MGVYPRRTITRVSIDLTGERWLETETQPGLTRTREVSAGPWSENRTDCYCCSCPEEGNADAACCNHGWFGKRPCEVHSLPGTPWEDRDVMPTSGQFFKFVRPRTNDHKIGQLMGVAVMSTRFLRARFPDGQVTRAHDSDFPLYLIEEIEATGRIEEDWSLELLDYKMELLQENFPLSDVRVSLDGERMVSIIIKCRRR